MVEKFPMQMLLVLITHTDHIKQLLGLKVASV